MKKDRLLEGEESWKFSVWKCQEEDNLPWLCFLKMLMLAVLSNSYNHFSNVFQDFVYVIDLLPLV